MTEVSLAKFLARCGYGPRNRAEVLIREGKVSVNGSTTRRLTVRVSPQSVVTVDARRVIAPEPKVTNTDKTLTFKVFLFHKKPKVLVTMSKDPQRRTLKDVLDEHKELPSLMPVGRLDYDSEGLLLLSNDGSLSRHLTHPSSSLPRTYEVEVKGAAATKFKLTFQEQ